jgi:hypothetical protein
MQSAFQEIFGGRSAQYIWEAMVINTRVFDINTAPTSINSLFHKATPMQQELYVFHLIYEMTQASSHNFNTDTNVLYASSNN